MTDAQKAWLRDAFSKIKGPWAFHHGDCVGSDAEAHDIAHEFGAAIIIHPPSNPDKRAFKNPGPRRIPKPYLERNKDIVNECDVLIGMPKEHEEQLRSGTWSTIRYARKQGKPLRVIAPDGTRI
jgi:hypothetical protein